MAEAAVAAGGRGARAGRPLLPAVAWRNLWRNGRRTWLTAGGIAFTVFLIVFSMSFQQGAYVQMIDNATALLSGHLQIQNRDYVEDKRIEQTVADVSRLVNRLEGQPGVESVAPRVEAFALISAGERAFGAQVLGVDPERERRTVRFFDRVAEGRMIEGMADAVVGEVLASNLGIGVGGEIVLLGTGKEGGVAALALDVVGVFRTGIPDLDRAMVAAPLAMVRDAFGLGDEAHTLVVRSAEVTESARLERQLNAWLPAPLIARNWDEVMPDIRQGIEIDRIGGYFVYGLIAIVVIFSVVNSFIMTVFERTREFGMLRAIGMRPGRIVLMVQIEAAFVWVLGAVIGLALALPIVLWLQVYGFYLGDEVASMVESMYVPARLHTRMTPVALGLAPAVMLVGTQIAALIPSLKIRRLQPVTALRAEE